MTRVELVEWFFGSGIMHLTAKDRLIAALVAQLRAERETRDALASVIANGQLDPDVLAAILTDPVQAVTQDDLNRADDLARQYPNPVHRKAA